MSNGSKKSPSGFNKYVYFNTRTFDVKHLKDYMRSIKYKLVYLCQNKCQMGVTDTVDI
jgi:hypothetical protein